MTTSPVTIVDVSDVSKAIVLLLNNAIFGQGNFPNPKVLTSASLNGTTVPIRIYRGWPSNDALQADVNPKTGAGGVNISVYTLPVTRNTTRFQPDEVAVSNAPITASLTVTGASVTVAGNGSNTNVVGIAYGSVAASYRPTAGETAQAIAAGLAAVLPGSTVSDATITLATTQPVIARAVSDVTSLVETARQAQRFLISIWAPSSTSRDLVGSIVHGAMSRAINLPLPYGVTTQSLLHRAMSEPQMDEKVGIFRRDETYEIEFPTVDMIVDPAVLFITPSVNNSATQIA